VPLSLFDIAGGYGGKLPSRMQIAKASPSFASLESGYMSAGARRQKGILEWIGLPVRW
jgi:hypothetical protein